VRTSAIAQQIQSQMKIIPFYDSYGNIQGNNFEVIEFTQTTVNEY
jgi:hypothetical protein